MPLGWPHHFDNILELPSAHVIANDQSDLHIELSRHRLQYKFPCLLPRDLEKRNAEIDRAQTHFHR
ncbi:hypothetical protein D3C76_1256620 [compost metagenome]